jgi:hypothetical protein
MSLEPLPLYLINAFTTTSPHSGNQAGVVVFPAEDPRAEDDEYLQKIARDVDYSETAFVVPLSEGEWSLRWFTPEVVSLFPLPVNLLPPSSTSCLYRMGDSMPLYASLCFPLRQGTHLYHVQIRMQLKTRKCPSADTRP